MAISTEQVTGARPYFVAVAGGSGSGKTTLVARIRDLLSRDQISVIEYDRYYRSRGDLDFESRSRLNFDHPDALEHELLLQHIRELALGRAVRVPTYEFSTHLRTDTTTLVEPTPIVLVEGILLLHDEQLRACFDLSIFVDLAADIRVLRRIGRDMRERGRSFEQASAQYFSTVRPMHAAFVEPSRQHADLVVSGDDGPELAHLLASRLSRGA